MTKRIVLLSDGTGNAAGKVWKSNVWRVFESLDLRGSDQVAFYDDGVGTSSFKPLAILGGAFGWGLKRNVLDIYKFLCANYQEGDEVYAFGFSRGAYTIRVVLGLALDQGLVKGATDAELYENAKMAYRAYRTKNFHTFIGIERPFRKLRDAVLYLFGNRYDAKNNQPLNRVEFVGVWDTVAAYGLPVDEMSRGVSQYIWPLELPDRVFNDKIQHACHALSLDDERTTFHPVLWNEHGVPAGRLHQVWFSGVHSNVGGGYPDDSLAHIPLYWIMTEAQKHGLAFKTRRNQPDDPDPDMMTHTQWRRDKDGRLYDSRNGLGGYYRYGPRKIADLSKMTFSWRKGDRVDNGPPTIHETAIERAQKGAHRYAPIGIPQKYDVLTDNGVQPQSYLESDAQAKARCAKQEEVWNYVWRRRIIYFMTVFASLYLAIYPLSRDIPPAGEFDNGLSLVSGAIRTLGQVLPGALSLWIDAYARDPSHLLFLGLLVVLLIWIGVWLGGKIRDRMERVWRAAPDTSTSTLEIAVKAVAALVALYGLSRLFLPDYVGLPIGDRFVRDHVSASVSIIGIFTLIALYTPERLVFHLRSWSGYRTFIRSLRLFILPLMFAISFLVAGVMFASHLAFSIEEVNGLVCHQSRAITDAIESDEDGEKGGTVENQGLQACLSAGIATCSRRGEPPTCTNRREIFCGEGQPMCEQKHKVGCNDEKENCLYLVPACNVSVPAEIGKPASQRFTGLAVCPAICETRPVGKAKLMKISEVCHATGIWLEEGQSYEINVSPDGKWYDRDGSEVSTEGTSPTRMVGKLREALLWPLKRHLFEERFKVIARVGPAGTDVTVLEPDDPNSDAVRVQLKPKRRGELFLYVNDAVIGLPRLYNYFYRGNQGQATITVHRPRQPS